jgi:hypothetical protein
MNQLEGASKNIVIKNDKFLKTQNLSKTIYLLNSLILVKKTENGFNSTGVYLKSRTSTRTNSHI